VRQARDRARRVVTHLVATERAGLAALRSRPVLADPHVLVDRRRDDVRALQERARRCTSAQLERARDDLDTSAPGWWR
jgi:exodeoxyribonuclease VII large subunit